GAKKLNFRFDLLNTLDTYRKLSVAPEFAPAILAGRTAKTQHGAKIFVPALVDDLALRFLEVLEWKDEPPDKTKHWRHIEKLGNFGFVDVVNRFTDLRINFARETGGGVKLSWTRQQKAPAAQAAAPTPDQAAAAATLVAQAEQEFAARRFVAA